MIQCECRGCIYNEKAECVFHGIALQISGSGKCITKVVDHKRKEQNENQRKAGISQVASFVYG